MERLDRNRKALHIIALKGYILIVGLFLLHSKSSSALLTRQFTTNSFLSRDRVKDYFIYHLRQSNIPHGKHFTTSLTMTDTKALDSTAQVAKDGSFVRSETKYRNQISADPENPFQPESGRYHLYISYACPWACRCLAIRNLKGLQDCISMTVVHPTWNRTKPDDPNDTHCGWIFAAPNETVLSTTGYASYGFPDTSVDHLNGAKTVRDLYELSGVQQNVFSVPVLWDKKLKKIVNNESSDIIRMLTHVFDQFSSGPFAKTHFYPEPLRAAIDNVNDWIYPGMNNGVYRCGFGKSQKAYDEAISTLTETFDRIEDLLSKQRYLVGNTLTEADIRLFVTLVRFDEVYIVYFKCNTRAVSLAPNILNYCREIYQLPGIKESVNMDHIKTHYFT